MSQKCLNFSLKFFLKYHKICLTENILKRKDNKYYFIINILHFINIKYFKLKIIKIVVIFFEQNKTFFPTSKISQKMLKVLQRNKQCQEESRCLTFQEVDKNATELSVEKLLLLLFLLRISIYIQK